MLRQAFITLMGFGGQMAVTLVAGILAARLLEPTGRGELAALLMLPMLLLQLANFGTPQALTYFTAREPKRAGALMGATFGLQAAATLAAIIIGWIAAPLLLDAHLVSAARVVLVLMLLVMPVYGTPMCVFLGRKLYVDYNLQRLLPSVVYLLAVLTAVAWQDPYRIAVVYLLGTLVIGLPYVAVAYRRKIGQRIVWRREALRVIWPYSLATFCTSLPQVIGQRLDQFVTLAVLSLTDLGHYSIAVGLGQMYLTFQLGLGTVLLPNLADKGDDLAARAAVFARMIRMSTLLAIGAVGCGVLLLPWVVPLMFGEAYLPAVAPAQVLLAAYGVLGVASILSDGFRGCGMPRLPLWMELVHVAVKAALFTVLFSGLDLVTVAEITLAGALVALGLGVLAYHLYVTPLNGAWWRGFGGDLRYMDARLRGIIGTRVARWK